MSLKIQVLCDNPDSWILPYAEELVEKLKNAGHNSFLLSDPQQVEVGDILVLLSCEKIFRKLNLNKNNLVVHESNLPEGKGLSPLTWQVLEGKNSIPVTLIEAAEKVDAGVIYNQQWLELNGTELVDELRMLQGKATQNLILKFVENYPNNKGKIQEGKESFYPKRTAKDSKLDINKTIAAQINLLRVVDNERYPAFFEYQGTKYILKIEKEKQA